MKNKYFILGVILLAALVAGGAVAVQKASEDQTLTEQVPDIFPTDTEITGEVNRDYVLLDVPFTAQAPTANWDDPRQQDGCEEASLLMAWGWVNNWTTIKPADAERTIIEMSEFEKQQYGNYLDLNAADTARLMKDYFKYDKLEVKYDITIDDIKKALIDGNLVIVPANGQKLGNPNFSGEGPVTHMLVIRGFNDSKNEVITNDPGTRKGNKYVYSYETIYNAMVDYPTGYHEDQTGRPKAMIVIEK